MGCVVVSSSGSITVLIAAWWGVVRAGPVGPGVGTFTSSVDSVDACPVGGPLAVPAGDDPRYKNKGFRPSFGQTRRADSHRR